MEDISKYKDTYLSEAKEHIGEMNKSLLKFEKHSSKIEPINDIFRHTHTLKSMSAAMDYNKTSRLCHAIEDVLDAVRKKTMNPDKCFDILFRCFDTMEGTLKELKKGREELDTERLMQELRATLKPSSVVRIPSSEKENRNTEYGIRNTEMEKIQSIEVKVERLDLLMNLAEELLINKMRIDRIKEELRHPELTAAVDALGRLITDIQYNVMQSRLVPIGFVFDRFPRMVRDLAKSQNKDVNLQTRGADIELDRGVIDEIGESLVHLIRNAIDHGIETPEIRKKTGKPAQSVIELAAKRERGFVIVEVSDDGSGLDIAGIKDTALKQGAISAGVTEEDIINSIFFGVSTSKQITQISGRGFGLNIVKEKIESIGGSIKVRSKPREGTIFSIEVPLTLAIIKSLFVGVGGKTYAVPLVNISRLITVNKEDIKGMLNYEAIVLDEEDIPIVRLNTLFKEPPSEPKRQPIVIIRKGEEEMGLAVDSFMNTREIVVKPLNKLVKENKYFAGSTIIGSGEVVLILDVANLMLTKRGYSQMVEADTRG